MTSLDVQRVGLLLLGNSFSLLIPAEHNNLAKATQKCLWCSRSQSLMVLSPGRRVGVVWGSSVPYSNCSSAVFLCNSRRPLWSGADLTHLEARSSSHVVCSVCSIPKRRAYYILQIQISNVYSVHVPQWTTVNLPNLSSQQHRLSQRRECVM